MEEERPGCKTSLSISLHLELSSYVHLNIKQHVLFYKTCQKRNIRKVAIAIEITRSKEKKNMKKNKKMKKQKNKSDIRGDEKTAEKEKNTKQATSEEKFCAKSKAMPRLPALILAVT